MLEIGDNFFQEFNDYLTILE